MELADNLHPALAKLIEQGIPVNKAIFRDAVNNGEEVPESYFSDKSQNKSRRVEMVWTQAGLVCLHNGNYFIVPPATVKYAAFKPIVKKA